MGASVMGWGAAVPERTLSNAELAAGLDVTEEWIFERTGIEARHIAGEHDSVASLAASATARALEGAGITGADVDLVIVATCSTESQLPARAPLVATAIGAPYAAAFDINAGCSGFVYGLAQAGAALDAGLARRAVVCGADILSRFTDYSDARSCILFGDGAGAAVVEHTEGAGRLGPFTLASDGSQPDLLWVPPDEGLIRMNGREVYRRAVDAMSASVRAILDEAGLSLDDVALLVAHQANARILRAVGLRLGLEEERVVLNIARFGNTSAASIPIALWEAAKTGRVKDGDLVVMTAFGAGFTWGSGLLTWGVGGDREASLVAAEKVDA